jgi:hypothetical protein
VSRSFQFVVMITFVSLCSCSVWADLQTGRLTVESKSWNVVFGTGAQLERSVNQESYESETAFVLGTRYSFTSEWQGTVEVMGYDQSSGFNDVQVEVQYRALNAAARWNPQLFYFGSPYVSLGGGVFQERVETRFLAEKKTSDSDFEFQVLGAVGGILNISERLSVELELQGQKPIQQSEPRYAILGKLGFRL